MPILNRTGPLSRIRRATGARTDQASEPDGSARGAASAEPPGYQAPSTVYTWRDGAENWPRVTGCLGPRRASPAPYLDTKVGGARLWRALSPEELKLGLDAIAARAAESGRPRRAIPELDAHLSAVEAFELAASEAAPDLDEDALKQASSNALVAFALQAIDGRTPATTSSILGYSLLYPLTDNLLDDPKRSSASKRDFAVRFAQRIAGGSLEATDDGERAIDRAFAMIEAEWPRERHSQLYALLAGMHQAQIASLGQHGDRGEAASLAALWAITVQKGGLSVVCDAALTKGAVDADEQRFAMTIGVLTQMLNDFQDIDEDLGNRQLTVVNRLVREGRPLDALFDHLLRQVRAATAPRAAEAAPVRSRQEARRTLLDGLRFRLIQCVALRPELFSPWYTRRTDRASPIPLEVIRTLTDRGFMPSDVHLLIGPKQLDLLSMLEAENDPQSEASPRSWPSCAPWVGIRCLGA